MKFVKVRGNPDASGILYDLLAERPRENWISHQALPTRAEHDVFVEAHPFLHWYLIDADGIYVGALECTDRNEIGVAILKRFQQHGYGSQALKLFLATHDPLPPIKAVRNGRWLANIAVANVGSQIFFSEHGFKPIQETWEL